MKLSLRLSFTIMALILPGSGAHAPAPAVYAIDAAHSRLELAVSRAGILKMAGHDHAIAARSFSGEVRFNSMNVEESSVTLNIESASLIVLDPDVPEKERQQVQETMQGIQVLNVRQFPRISFHSTQVRRVAATGEDFMLAGKLNLHGVEKEIAFPVRVHMENNRLRATGTPAILQTDFGIKPITAVLGTVRVKDQVKIKFDFVAERTNP